MRSSLFWFLVIVILVACAKIVPPDGGDRDETPPELLILTPKNESTNFRSKSIYAGFDEYVQLSDIQNQLVVSPPLREKPDVKLKKKGVLLTFQEELLPNVTYTINFGEGIKDFTEGNPAELIYVFSTGPVLDSLEFSGRIVDAFTGDPVKGVRVMLYKDTTRTMPLEEKPYYFARTNEEGYYRFAYLAPGSFRLFALEELNMNYLFDDPTERIAFIDSLVVPGTPSDSLVLADLYLSQQMDTALYINAFDSDSSGFLRMQVNREWTSEGRLEVEDSTLRPILFFRKPDSLYAWTETLANREIEWRFEALSKRDTFDVRSFPMGKRSLGMSAKTQGTIRSDRPLKINFNRPISFIDSSKIRLLKDSLPMDIRPFASKDDPFAVSFQTDLSYGASYTLDLYEGAVVSREGWACDSINWKFSTHDADHYGKLMLKIKGFELDGDGRLQLYREGQVEPDFEMVIEGDVELEVDRLMPATYKLRLIDDANYDGKWTPADYLNGRQPERVYNLKEDISIRSNWEMEVDWVARPAP